MRRTKKNSGILAYLHNAGALEASDAVIKEAKKEYYKLYKRNWKRAKRKASKKIELLLDKQTYNIIRAHAKTYKRTVPRFMREATLSYLQKKYLIPDVVIVHEIKGLLIMNYSQMQRLCYETSLSVDKTRAILNSMEALEKQIIEYISNPKEVS